MLIKACTKEQYPKIKKFICHILHDELHLDLSSYPHSDLDAIGEAYGGNREVFYCLEDHGDVVGTVAVKNDDENVALLRRLFIDEKYRGRGLGRKLVEKALEFCRQQKYKKVCFRCAENMKAAMALCKSFGFTEDDVAELGKSQIFLLEKKL